MLLQKQLDAVNQAERNAVFLGRKAAVEQQQASEQLGRFVASPKGIAVCMGLGAIRELTKRERNAPKSKVASFFRLLFVQLVR